MVTPRWERSLSIPSSARKCHLLQALAQLKLRRRLTAHRPLVVSTILLGLDHVGSDVDVVAFFANRHQFRRVTTEHFGALETFKLSEPSPSRWCCRFWFSGFLFELTGEALPSRQQRACQHFCLMGRVLRVGGIPVQHWLWRQRQERKGIKVERLLCEIFGLSGENPYQSVLGLQSMTDVQLQELIGAFWRKPREGGGVDAPLLGPSTCAKLVPRNS